MANQAPLGTSPYGTNGSSRFNSMGNGATKKKPDAATVGAVTAHFSDLAYDLITLTELQARLLLIDVREALARSALSIVGLVAMAALALSSVPVFLLGVAELLVQYAEWSRAASYLTVGGIALVVAIGFGAWAAYRLTRIAVVFQRSTQELQDNLEFVKSLLQRRSEEDQAESR